MLYQQQGSKEACIAVRIAPFPTASHFVDVSVPCQAVINLPMFHVMAYSAMQTIRTVQGICP